MSVNKVILIGNVGKDPEVRYLENDVSVANFPLATTERGFTSRSGQEVPDRTEWHNIVAWRGLAKIVESYVKKGSPLYIEGKLRTRSYDDKDGNKRYTTEIFADNIELLGRKSDSDGSAGNSNAGTTSQPASTSSAQPTQSENKAADGDSDVDDLPF